MALHILDKRIASLRGKYQLAKTNDEGEKTTIFDPVDLLDILTISVLVY